MFMLPDDRSSSSETVVITGGTAGIGAALVELYLERGVRVVTCGRKAEPRRTGALTVLRADVSTSGGRERLVEVARDEAQNGRILGLINNAAIQRSYAMADGAAHAADLSAEISVNLLAPIALGHLLFNGLQPVPGDDYVPFVANISSGLAYIPLGRSPVYCATKAGLSHYTRSVRAGARFAASHCVVVPRMVEVVLPLVDTRMTEGRGDSKLNPAEAARQIVGGLDAGRHTVRVGKARLLPALLRLVPGALTNAFNRAERPPLPAALQSGEDT
jgi:uncharacterized oxidoreductase